MSIKRILTLSTLVAAAAMFSFGCSALLDVDSLQEGGEKKDKGAEAGQKDGGTDATPDKKIDPDIKPDQKAKDATPDVKTDQKIVKDVAVDQKVTPDMKSDQKVTPDVAVDQKVTPDMKPDQKLPTPDQKLPDQKLPDQAVTTDQKVTDMALVDQAAGGNCTDGKINGSETDVDCGGSCPQKCDDMKKCATGTDCVSGVCGTGKTCDPPSCTDTVKNGEETDVDCGGPACAGQGNKCADTKSCNEDNDCTNNWCNGSACATNPAHCTNTTLDTASGETDVDCGGPCKDKCDATKGCKKSDDCKSKLCDIAVTPFVCKAATCTDSIKNGDETDVDCGGATCVAAGKTCGSGLSCEVHTDCTSTYCSFQSGSCGTEPTHCTSTTLDGDESDVDCGGSCKAGCAVGKKCNGPPDCDTGNCDMGASPPVCK